MAYILKPCEFPVLSSKDLRKVYPLYVVEKFKTHFCGDAITMHMIHCVDEPAHTEMRDMRDVLSHRGVLPRSFYQGGEQDGMATMPTNPKDPIDQWRYDFSIDVETTASRRQWLCDTITELVAAAGDFCSRRL
jgi:hypothetical protein